MNSYIFLSIIDWYKLLIGDLLLFLKGKGMKIEVGRNFYVQRALMYYEGPVSKIETNKKNVYNNKCLLLWVK